ncbi:hypothetical protein [Chitinophaga filiformis]|uniref:HlyD family secretion protein n=1 Tax=Chitinophaga filiformis TaxID=104663 RepID=A0ABY4I721_CHIFI|nr:hypothetical protein [Chitinophaga filiformis]UPK71672.1 hypothetical protein MYF79_10305 [Chitinophaga filiformis]
MPANNYTEQHSQEIEELIGHIPHWLIRFGLTGMLIIALISLAVSALIPSPRTVNAEALIIAREQPDEIVIRKEYPDEHFQFRTANGDRVKQGDTLLVRQDEKTGKTTSIQSPAGGQVYITSRLHPGNVLQWSIWVIRQQQGYVIQLKSSNMNFNKVKVGQVVRINLDKYPMEEFGVLEGRVTSIIPNVRKDEYEAVVALPGNSLITTEKKNIPPQPVMQGTAQIHLDEKTLFERIFGSVFGGKV